MSATPFRDVALHYAAEHGCAVFPLRPRTKLPLTANGCKAATTHPEQIAEWAERWPEANVGLATGAVSGLVALDVDGPEGAAALLARCPVLPLAPMTHTGRGAHLLFAHPGVPIGNSVGRLGPALDTRGDGGYIVAPPSIHPDGHAYAWEPGRSLDDVTPPPLPPALREALALSPRPATQAPPAPATDIAPRAMHAQHVWASPAHRTPAGSREAELRRFRAYLATVDTGLTEGQGRNATAFRIAARALECMSVGEARTVVEAWNTENRPPLSPRELDATIQNAVRYGRRSA